MNGNVAEDGKVVTDGMIEGWESELERDERPSGWANVGDVVEGEPTSASLKTITPSSNAPAGKIALSKMRHCAPNWGSGIGLATSRRSASLSTWI